MSDVSEQVIDRHAARVLLLDKHDRLLLFRCQEPGAERAFWITPGGGLEDGESHEQAAERELFEETGLTGVPLGSCVWMRSHTFPWMGRMYRQHERFFLVRVDDHAVDVACHTEEEQAALTEHRWWSVAAIQGATDDFFAPRSIGRLLSALLVELPKQPIDVGA